MRGLLKLPLNQRGHIGAFALAKRGGFLLACGNNFATVRFAASAGVVVHLRDKLDIGLAVVQAGGRLGLGDGGVSSVASAAVSNNGVVRIVYFPIINCV